MTRDGHTTNGGARPAVWIVDDEPDLIDAVGGLLSDAGFECRGIGDPREVARALDEHVPDLLVVDLNMPHISGAELIRDLRTRATTRDVPILVLTALSSESSLLNAFEAGADDVVRKPFSTSEFLARINWQLTRTARLRELKRENEDLFLMTQFAKVMSQDDSLPSILRTLVDMVRSSLDVAHCSVYLVHEASGDLHRALPAEPSRSEGSPNMVLDLRSLPEVSDRLIERQPVRLGSEATTRLIERMGGHYPTDEGRHSSAIFPMCLKDTLVGILVLLADRERIAVGAREKSIAGITADFAAVAVHRADLFDSVRQEHERIDQAMRELSKARDFLQGVIESSPDAIVVSDTESGSIQLFNRAAESILGWTQTEAAGMNVRGLYPDGGAERIMHLLRSKRFGGPGKLEPKREILVDRDGNEIPVEISAAIIYDDHGDELTTVGIFTDLRGRLQMEEKLQETTEHLERTRRRAVAAELAGAMAHELNQPLTSLLGYAELLRKRLDEGDENWRPAEKIYEDAHRVADIVRKIGRITEYKTKEYVGGTLIVDLDQSSDVEDDESKSPQALLQGDPGSSTQEIRRELIAKMLADESDDESHD